MNSLKNSITVYRVTVLCPPYSYTFSSHGRWIVSLIMIQLWHLIIVSGIALPWNNTLSLHNIVCILYSFIMLIKPTYRYFQYHMCLFDPILFSCRIYPKVGFECNGVKKKQTNKTKQKPDPNVFMLYMEIVFLPILWKQ